jgi:hypothetical protein
MIKYTNIVFDDLYNNIIKANSKKYRNLRVITGYSSAIFIKKIVSEFPNLNLTIYIGMARHGILKKDHVAYCNLVKENKVKIHYQITDPGTHQKVLEFYNNGNDHIGYIGSANFSENGFGQQREVMAVLEDDLSIVFRKQAKLCLSCVDSKTSELIPISECISNNQFAMLESQIEVNQPSFDKNNIRRYENNFLVAKDSTVQYGYVAQLVPDQYDQMHSGINAEPSFIYLTGLESMSSNSFRLMVGKNKYSAYRGGELNRNVMLKDEDIGNVIRKILKIPENRKVGLNTLKKIGCVKVSLIPVGFNQYTLELIKFNE